MILDGVSVAVDQKLLLVLLLLTAPYGGPFAVSSLLTEPPRLLNAEDMKLDGMFVLESGYEAWNGTAARTNLEHKT